MKTIVIYPGRFQPFHKGHGMVFKWLKKKFSTVYIATSNKVELPKSPFNFNEKTKMMNLAGVPSTAIKEVKLPYVADEILNHYGKEKVAVIFAVSQKDMDEDPRFAFKPKKDGSPSYYQKYQEGMELEPASKRGYILVTPTFNFNVLGVPMKSASEFRSQFAHADDETAKKLVKDLFGKYSEEVYKLMREKIKKPSTLKEIRERLNEAVSASSDIDHDKFGPMLDSFVSFASKELGIKSLPNVKLQKVEGGMQPSFGGYNPKTKELMVTTKNRHPMDIFRTVAHELVHHKQNEDGRIKDVQKEGSTGSEIENEANAMAGVVMRNFGKNNPNNFGLKYVKESVDLLNESINDPTTHTAIFLIGGPGSGKDFTLKQLGLTDEHGLKEINSDTAFEHMMRKHGLDFKMPEEEETERDIVRGKAKNTTKERERLYLNNRNGIVINGVGGNVEETLANISHLKGLGYKTAMIHVKTANEVSRQRNIQRGQEGGRTVPEKIRQAKWNEVDQAGKVYEKALGSDYMVVDNSHDLRTAPPEIKKQVLGQIDNVSRRVGSLIRQDITHPNAIEWLNKKASERGAENYTPPRAMQGRYGPVKKPTSATPQEFSKAKSMGLKYFGFGRYGKNIQGKNVVTHYSQGGNLVARPRQMSEEKDPCWKGYEMVGMKKKKGKKVPNCVPVKEGQETVVMTKVRRVRRRLAEMDLTDTSKREWGTDSLTNLYKSMTPGQGGDCGHEKKTKKVMRRKLNQENVTTPLGYDLGNSGIGPTYTFSRSPSGLGFGYSIPMSESVEKWANDPETQKMFMRKYGEQAKVMLEERIVSLLESAEKGVFDKQGLYSGRGEDIEEAKSPAWQRKEGKSASGGLNKKGVASYRRANPGSKLQTAVTTEPSKLKKGSKSAKRRISFCKRMSGMKKKLTSSKTANDPDSRINKALRKWNC